MHLPPTDWSGPYAHYAATPGAVRASAQRVTTTAGNVQELDESVRAGHAPAPAGVTGILLGPLSAAPRPVREDGHRGGLLRLRRRFFQQGAQSRR